MFVSICHLCNAMATCTGCAAPSRSDSWVQDKWWRMDGWMINTRHRCDISAGCNCPFNDFLPGRSHTDGKNSARRNSLAGRRGEKHGPCFFSINKATTRGRVVTMVTYAARTNNPTGDYLRLKWPKHSRTVSLIPLTDDVCGGLFSPLRENLPTSVVYVTKIIDPSQAAVVYWLAVGYRQRFVFQLVQVVWC